MKFPPKIQRVYSDWWISVIERLDEFVMIKLEQTNHEKDRTIREIVVEEEEEEKKTMKIIK